MSDDIIAQVTAQPPDELQAIVSQIVGEDATPVGELTATKIGRSAGHATAGIFLVRGQAQRQGQLLEWSAVTKVLGEPENRSPAVDYGALGELDVYRSRAFTEVCGGVRAPHCYAIQQRDVVQILWLEDLSHAPQAPWEPQHFLAAARHLGQFNAHWPEQQLPTWEWLNPFDFRTDFTGNPRFQEAFAHFGENPEHPLMQAFVPQAEAQAFVRLWDECDALLAAAKMTPMGICHLDCHPKNLFPILDGDGPGYTVAIDWTKVGVGNLGVDIGHLLASPMTWLELSTQEAAALREPIFAAYLSGLTDAGWSGNESQVRAVYLTRLAGEAMRNTSLISHSIQNPQWLGGMERALGHPIGEICERYRAAREFFVDCKNEAARLI